MNLKQCLDSLNTLFSAHFDRVILLCICSCTLVKSFLNGNCSVANKGRNLLRSAMDLEQLVATCLDVTDKTEIVLIKTLTSPLFKVVHLHQTALMT